MNIKSSTNNILENVKLHIKNYKFWMTIILYFTFLIVRSHEERQLPLNVSVNYFLTIVYNLSDTNLILLIFSCLPVITIFIDDWKSGRILNILTRTSSKKYIENIILTSGIISFLVPLISNILYIIFLSFKYDLFLYVNPLETQKVYTEFNFLGGTLYRDKSIFYYSLILYLRSAYFSILCIFSVLFTILIVNKNISYILPAIIYLIQIPFININELFFISPDKVLSTQRFFYNGIYHYLGYRLSEQSQILYTIIYYLVMFDIIIAIGTIFLKKKLKKEASFGGGIENE